MVKKLTLMNTKKQPLQNGKVEIIDNSDISDVRTPTESKKGAVNKQTYQKISLSQIKANLSSPLNLNSARTVVP